MYASLDFTDLLVVHKHPDWHCVADLVHIELPTQYVAVVPIDDAKAFRALTDDALRVLCRNTLGELPDVNTPRAKLIEMMLDALDALAPSRVDPVLCRAQAALCDDPSSPMCYNPRGERPRRVDGYVPEGLRVASDTAANIQRGEYSRVILRTTASNPVQPKPEETDMARKQPAAKPTATKVTTAKKKEKAKAPAAPRVAKRNDEPQEEQNGVKRPRAGSVCRRVWDIADKLSKKAPVPFSALAEVTNAEGLNESNARAEYSRWRKFHGITGRIVA